MQVAKGQTWWYDSHEIKVRWVHGGNVRFEHVASGRKGTMPYRRFEEIHSISPPALAVDELVVNEIVAAIREIVGVKYLSEFQDCARSLDRLPCIHLLRMCAPSWTEFVVLAFSKAGVLLTQEQQRYLQVEVVGHGHEAQVISVPAAGMGSG